MNIVVKVIKICGPIVVKMVIDKYIGKKGR